MSLVSEAQILNALKVVNDPDLNRDIVSLGFVKNIKICDGNVAFDVELTTPACPVKDLLKQQAHDAVKALPNVTNVEIKMTAQAQGRPIGSADVLKGVKNVIAIASGKGGVGKSTATTNLALSLTAMGAKVGILDADVYGPSVPGMLGITERPRINDDGKAIPPEAYGVKVMSVSMMMGPNDPGIWRGPIVSRILQQFLSAVEWGNLDYLLMDLPPGTGDVQLTLTQSASVNGAVIVTTPQDVALRIARKGLRMFQTVNVPILGIIENMAGFVCTNCGTIHDIFKRGGAELVAAELGVPLLGSIPLDPMMVQAGDAGKPLVAFDKNSSGALAFEAVAKRVVAQISIVNFNESTVKNRPQEMHLHDKTPPSIVWDDGAILKYNAFELRMACPCAGCNDEMTGVKTLREEDVPRDIKVLETRAVGRYGQAIVFSDGHSSGIYVNDLLKSLGK